MRPEPNKRLDQYRRSHPDYPDTAAGVNHGIFRIGDLKVISSGTNPGGPLYGEEIWQWEHVSVSARHRCPTLEEMCKVKDLFWGEEETVVQFHPAKSKYVNHHPHCLHLWKQVGLEMNLPPKETLA